MPHLFDSIWKWLQMHANLLEGAGLFSLIMFAATLVAAPLIVIRLPSGYLNEKKERLPNLPLYWRWPYLVVKNVIGAALVSAGLAMLILPGQGLLTLAIGLTLMNFPGKRRLILRVAGQPRFLRAANRLRARANQEPLEAPQNTDGD